MKRRISLLLAVVMILGTFSFTFAAEATPEEVAGEFLMDNDVIEGINGELKLEDNFRRQDMVVMISRLMGAEEEAAEYPTDELTFTDFSDPYYRPIIAWAVAEELIEGHTDERFGFNEDVTAQQYATVLLRALGYNDEVAGDGYDEALELAADLGILGDYEFENDDAITRGEMFVMTFNALGVTMKDSDETLADFLGIEMPEEPKATELEAEVNDTENLKEIVVELSNAELADEDKLVDTNSYKLTGNVIEAAELDGDNVILLLRDALVKGREYELVVRGIDKKVNGKYEFVAKDNTIPAIESVEVLGEYGIKVTTTEPVYNPRERDFLIDGKNVAMNLEQYGRDIILTPYHSKSFDEDAETLTIKQLNDFAGYKSAQVDFDIEIVKDEVGPEVVDAIVRGNTVEVVFDKDIYEDSLEAYYNRSNVGNIYYKDGKYNVYAEDVEKVDTNKAVYTFEDVLPRRTVVTIADVQNHSKVAMEETEIEARELVDYTEPEIIDTKLTKLSSSSVRIKLYFDKDVKGEFLTDAKNETRFDPDAHFTLYEYEVLKRNISENGEVVSAEYDDDRRDVVVVIIEGLTEYNAKKNDLNYILEIEDFTDATTQRNRMYRDYYEFKVNPASSAFKVNDIFVNVGKYDTEITIEFSKPVDRVIAENPANYIFRDTDGYRYDVDDLEGEVITETDGYTVTLILPDFDPDDYSTLTILEVLKDKDGRRLNEETLYTFGNIFSGLAAKADALLVEAADYPSDTAVQTAAARLQAFKDAGYLDRDHEKILDAIEDLEDAIADAKEAKEAEDALNDAKTLAKDKLDKYVDVDDYKINKTALTDAINAGKDAIDAARTTKEINAALADAKEVIDEIETDAEIVALIDGKEVTVEFSKGEDKETVLAAIKALAPEHAVIQALEEEKIAIADGKATVTFVAGVTATVNITELEDPLAAEKAAKDLIDSKTVNVETGNGEDKTTVLAAIKALASENEIIQALGEEDIEIADGKATVTIAAGVIATVNITEA